MFYSSNLVQNEMEIVVYMHWWNTVIYHNNGEINLNNWLQLVEKQILLQF